MNKIFNKFRIFIISLIIVTVGLLTISFIPTHKDLIVPAETLNVRDTYQFNGIDTKDINIYSVSVYSYYKVTVVQYLIGLLNPYSIIDEHNDIVNTSSSYTYSSGTIQKNVSLTNALIAGYEASGKEISYTFLGYIIHSLYGDSANYFKVGDLITKVAGVEVTNELSVNDILLDKYGYVQREDGKYYLNVDVDTEYLFTVERNGQVIELAVKPFMYDTGSIKTPIFGFSAYEYYYIDTDKANPSFSIISPDTIGPSAGLVQSLFVYEALSGEKLTKNLKICGTGTISAKGKVGSIGGVQSKLTAAESISADIFFVPKDNYEDALERYNKLNYRLKLVPVETLGEAINYLREYQGGNQ